MTLRGQVWVPIGPSPLTKPDLDQNGRVSSIYVSPSNRKIIYLGTAGGGLWKSTNGGFGWTPLFDREVCLGIGSPAAIAVDPFDSNVLYVGTSNRLNKEPFPGGLFKSMDGGQSWIRLGSGYPPENIGNAKLFFEQNINISVVIIDPTDSNTLHLATDNGVYRSADGGLNWIQGKISIIKNLTGTVRSLVLDSSVPGLRILYAGIVGQGVYRSNDGGFNWTRILGVGTPGVQPPFGKVVVDIPPPTQTPNSLGVQVIYVAIRGIGGEDKAIGIYMSKDQGATWLQQAGNDVPAPSGDYAFHMAVDPASPGDGANDIIYLGGIGQRRSDDSGNNFENISLGLHPDTHAWAFFKQANSLPSVVYCGNDGGLFKSTDKGSTWRPHNGGPIQTSLIYNITCKPTDNQFGYVVGAFQDNSIYAKIPHSGSQWKGGAVGLGDGGDVAYNSDYKYLYASIWGYSGVGTHMHRSTNDGLAFQKDITPWIKTDDTGWFVAPIATDHNTAGIVYVSGSQKVWQSFDSGSSWRSIMDIINACNDIDVAEGNGNYVVMSIGSQVYVSINALAETVGPPDGLIFTDITRNLPGRNVTRVRFDPNDPNTIYATLSGFYRDTDPPNRKGHVFRTSISGSAWIDLSPPVNVPCSALALDGEAVPTSIFVGTEFGVISSVDGGRYWNVLDDLHFPRVPVLDLEFKNFRLVAGTYGRGAFIFTYGIIAPIVAVNKENNLEFGTVRQGPKYLKLQIMNTGYSGGGTGFYHSDLRVDSVQRLMGSDSFSVLPTPITPLPIHEGEHADFTIMFNPSGAGVEEKATIRVITNDFPGACYLDFEVTGRQEPYD